MGELSAKPEVTPEKTKSPTMMDVEPVPAAPVVVKPAIDVAPLLDRIRKVMARDAPAAGQVGLTVQDVIKGLADASVSSGEVQAKVQQLVEDGEAFPTIDDDHFAPV